MYDLIWQIFQQRDIDQGKFKDKIHDEKFKGNQHQLDSTEQRLMDLEQRHEQLKLVTLAMWSLLRDHSGLLESDLKKYIEEIDMLDGTRDGKYSVQKERVECHVCGRINLNTALVCAYCGTRARAKPFDGA